VYGTKGILGVPDPNYFRGPVKVRSNIEESAWHQVPLLYSHTDGPGNFRGLGVVEMALAIGRGDEPRASGRLAYHVLDVMQSILESSTSGRHIKVQSSCRRPEPLPIETGLEMTS
jgi:predicted dehydrogenase